MNKPNADLYRRLREYLGRVRIIDCHEHLPAEDKPEANKRHLGRFFLHYAICDLISAGMPAADRERLCSDTSDLTPQERWRFIEPWYKKTWNTAYCECLRIALRDLYGFDDFNAKTVGPLTDALEKHIKPGWTREVFDRAGIDFAMNNRWEKPVFITDQDPKCFIPDKVDGFTGLGIDALRQETGREIFCLDDYLKAIDHCFERYGRIAGALKVSRAYDRILFFDDVPKSAVEKSFNRLLAMNDRPDRRHLQALEDFILHYLCRKCGEYGLRLKFHTGLQEGNGNIIRHSRASLLANLFLKYPKTPFDIYHISYPYQEEAIALVKNFPNVTINFCWMWIINPAAGRRALADMLDTVPANKIHGFGGDFLFVEGTYGHAQIARREIARVLAEKVEEGRFSEDYACQIGSMLLRDNALENFGLAERRKAYARIARAPGRKK
ncbi:MAG: amidohydrolase family protein [Planctomycetota bacterium]|nr:amidohydrolase family protein [Planctomycetota bacterium]